MKVIPEEHSQQSPSPTGAAYNLNEFPKKQHFEIEGNRSLLTPINPKIDSYPLNHKLATTPKQEAHKDFEEPTPDKLGGIQKLLSHRLPLNLNFQRPALDDNFRRSLFRHHDPKSQFEETTIMDIYEKRISSTDKNWLGYIFVLLVIASGASFVPFGVNLDIENPMLKVSWRVTNLIPFLGILGVSQAYFDKHFQMKSIFETSNLINLVIAAIAISIQQFCAIFAGKYTLMSHSVIFVNLSGPVIVGWRLIRLQYVHLLEMVGCGIAIIGSVVSIMDHTSEKANPAEQNILLGDSVALIGSFLCALWMMKNEEIVQKVPPLYAMTFIMIFSNIILVIVGLSLFDDFTFDLNPQTGVFGFLNEDLWVYVIFVYGFFTGACNMGSYSMSCKYFSPLVIGTAVLFEPIGSQIIGCLLGLDKIPGFVTFLGTFVTLIGLFFVAKGGQLKAIKTQHI